MRKKRSAWTRTRMESRVVVCHFPKVEVRVAAQSKSWSWRVKVGNEGVAMGDAATREAAEAGGVARVKEIVKEIERACP